MARVASQLTQMGFLELALDRVQGQAKTANKSHCLSAFLQSWSVEEQLICGEPWQQALSKNKLTVSTFQDPFSPCCSPENIMLMLWWGKKKIILIFLREPAGHENLSASLHWIKVIFIVCKIVYHNVTFKCICNSLMWNKTCIVN